jgi:hypothetical protein
MIGKRPPADRIPCRPGHGYGTASREVGELTGAGHAIAVAGLRELAAGRAGLLAEIAGTLEGFAEGELHQPACRGKPRSCAVTPERIRVRYLPGPG